MVLGTFRVWPSFATSSALDKIILSSIVNCHLFFWHVHVFRCVVECSVQIRYGTFVRQWNQKWTLVLKFRDQNSFSQCDVCQDLKEQLPRQTILSFCLIMCPLLFCFFLLKVFLKIILFQLRFQNRELSMDVRLGALRLYRQHLVSQYSDRCAFWSLRDISAETFSRCITIMTDGADQDITFVFYSFSSCNFKNYFSVTWTFCWEVFFKNYVQYFFSWRRSTWFLATPSCVHATGRPSFRGRK